MGSDATGAEQEQRAEGLALAQRALERHRVVESPDWRVDPLVTSLAADERAQLMEDMGELLLLAAGAAARQADLDRALRLNDLAGACYSADKAPRARWKQRAELVRLAGRPDEAQRLAVVAGQTPAPSARDRYLLLLTEFAQQGRLPGTVPLLKEISASQKDNFAVWVILGNTWVLAGDRKQAIDYYEIAGALRPESRWPPLCRGLAYLELREFGPARTAFDEVIRLDPDTRGAYYDRALASFHLGDHSSAENDLTHLLSSPKPPLRAYFLRARVRLKQGDREGALRDREQGLHGEPYDARDWTARGLERQHLDPHGALADYQAALKIDPRYRTALQDMANVLAEDLGRTQDAIAALDKLLDLYPNDVPALAGRGVLHARLGHRDAALVDAQSALAKSNAAFYRYQVAGIYSLTSRVQPDDRREALALLESALRDGTGLDLLERDHDLDTIRNDREFYRIVDVARANRRRTGAGTIKAKAGGGGRQPAGSQSTQVPRSGS